MVYQIDHKKNFEPECLDMKANAVPSWNALADSGVCPNQSGKVFLVEAAWHEDPAGDPGHRKHATDFKCPKCEHYRPLTMDARLL